MKKLIKILKDQEDPENIKCLYGAPPPMKKTDHRTGTIDSKTKKLIAQ